MSIYKGEISVILTTVFCKKLLRKTWKWSKGKFEQGALYILTHGLTTRIEPDSVTESR